MPKKEDEERVPVLTPHQVFPTWIVFGIFSVLLGIGCFISSALLLSATSDFSDCTAFSVIGGVLMPVGVIIIILGVLALIFRIIQPHSGPLSVPMIILKIVLGFFIMIFYLALILCCTIGVAMYILSRNTPHYDVHYKNAKHITQSVCITRDDHGVPLIHGRTVEDVLFGQGFTMGQDRLFQLELQRLFAKGELSKYLGEAAVELDHFSRAVGFYRSAQDTYNRLPEKHRRYLSRYMDGVNFYLDKEVARPPEFMFFRTLLVLHEPEGFTGVDALANMLIASYQMAYNLGNEAERWKLFSHYGHSYADISSLHSIVRNSSSILDWRAAGISEADRVNRNAAEDLTLSLEEQLYNTVMQQFREPKRTSSSSRRMKTQSTGGDTKEEEEGEITDEASIVDRMWRILHPKNINADMTASGSNSWHAHAPNGPVVGAGDPHLQAASPSPFVLTHFNIDTTFDVVGGSFVGFPGIQVGRNSYRSQGITLSIQDAIDTWVMQPDPNRADTHYMHNGVSKAYNTWTETIEVKGGKDRTITVRESIYGPDIAEALELSSRHRICAGVKQVLNATNNLTAMFALLDEDVRTVTQTFAVFQEGNMPAPMLTISMGDTSGQVGFYVLGAINIRRSGHSGYFPMLGNGSFDPIGLVETKDQTRSVSTSTNTAQWVGVANARPLPDGAYPKLHSDGVPAYRQRRLNDVLAQTTATNSSRLSDLEFHRQLQRDDVSSMWFYEFRPLLTSNSTDAFGSRFRSLLDVTGRAQLDDMINNWDSNASVGSSAAYVWNKFVVELARAPKQILQDLDYYAYNYQGLPARLMLNPTASHQRWCREFYTAGSPNLPTGGINDCVEFSAHTWNRVVASSAGKRWGYDGNVIEVQHRIMHGSALQCMFDRKVEPASGDMWSLQASGTYTRLTSSDLKAHRRAVFKGLGTLRSDDANPSSTAPTNAWHYEMGLGGNGVSGNPFSKYYMDIFEHDAKHNGYVRRRSGLQRFDDYQCLEPED